jgi:hypothetical protein
MRRLSRQPNLAAFGVLAPFTSPFTTAVEAIA